MDKGMKIRLYAVYVLALIVSTAIAVTLFKLQIVEGKELRSKALSFSTEMRKVEANRGNIYADDASMLATSVPVYDVRMDLKAPALTDEIFNAEVDSLSQYLANFFKDKSALDYKHSLITARNRGRRYHLVKRRINYNELQVIKTFPIFRKGRYKGGVIFEKQNIRKNPFGFLGQRTIGYSRKSGSKVGLEGAYNKTLEGVSGLRLERRLAGGVWMPISDENEVEPEDGLDVYSTIDINIQDVAENALLKQLQKQDADHGCVILMEVKTGNIKAIANLSKHQDGSYSERYNYAIGESTEPGSTFKLASVMAAMEDGFVNLKDSVDAESGVTYYYGIPMHDSKEGGWGKISVQRSFEVSSNIGISKLVSKYYKNNPTAFINRMKQFGLHQKLGLEIVGEGDPLVKDYSKDPKIWSGITLTQMSIGYEVLQTPLQILTFYNAVANNGIAVKPRFATHLGRNGKKVEEIPVTVLNEAICSPKTINQARTMLEGVVERGTATNLRSASFPIAGKTGTARIANKSYGYNYQSDYSYQASFVGYFPADKPLYSCIVVVNAPSNSVYYGNLVAGPIFREIADKIYSNRIDTHEPLNQKDAQPQLAYSPASKSGYRADLKTVFETLEIPMKEQTENEWVWTYAQEKEVVTKAAPIKSINDSYVPNVRGMGLQDAIYLLENRGLKVNVFGRGTVKEQSLQPGTPINAELEITLQLS